MWGGFDIVTYNFTERRFSQLLECFDTKGWSCRDGGGVLELCHIWVLLI